MKRVLKSQTTELGFYTELVIRLLRDMAHCAGISTVSGLAADIKYVRTRANSEGLSFFTLKLPSLGRCLDEAMARGSYTSPPPYHKTVRVEEQDLEVPAFMQDYWRFIVRHWRTVESAEAEVLNPGFSKQYASAIRSIRQVSYLFYKLYMPYSDKQVRSSYERVISNDAELPDSPKQIYDKLDSIDDAYAYAETGPIHVRDKFRVARDLIHYIFRNVSVEDVKEALVPRHGAGALATREKPWEKYTFAHYYPSLDNVFSYADFFFVNHSHLCEHLEKLEGMQDADIHSRATVVPKDSRGPRIISMEPLELMFMQQALWRWLKRFLEREPPTAGKINFTSQDVNRDLCRSASITRRHVTLDLKDASDRVSVALVEALFPPRIAEMLLALRSKACIFPNRKSPIVLKKFAPMGSAICFPIEALIFWALSVAAVQPCLSLRNAAQAEVWVYGDDLVLPSGSQALVTTLFGAAGLVVNESKSCVGSFPFRESCGLDAILGEDVSPLRIKHRWSADLSPEALMAWTEYANNLSGANLRPTYLTARALVGEMLDTQPHVILKTANPCCQHKPSLYCPEVEGLAPTLVANSRLRLRWNTKLQRQEYRFKGVLPVTTTVTQTDGWVLLFDRLTREFDPDSVPVVENRGTYSVPNQSRFGYRWIPCDEVVWP